jgi:predicted nucleic acid-binding protein
MSRLVVDTDVVSFLFKGSARAKLYDGHLIGHELIISFMTVAELYKWVEEKNWGAKKIELLESYLRKFFVCSVDPGLCRMWGRVVVDGKRRGKPIQSADAWVAATAMAYGVPLVTHNLKHFSNVDKLTVISEPDI